MYAIYLDVHHDLIWNIDSELRLNLTCCWTAFLNLYTVFLTEFLVSLGDDRSVAERIINDAFVAPNRMMELIDELSQLYLQKFRFEDPGKCATAIIYAGHLRVLRMFDIRELLPTSETEQSNSIGTASTLTMSTHRRLHCNGVHHAK